MFALIVVPAIEQRRHGEAGFRCGDREMGESLGREGGDEVESTEMGEIPTVSRRNGELINIAFLAFGYVVGQCRGHSFSGFISSSE